MSSEFFFYKKHNKYSLIIGENIDYPFCLCYNIYNFLLIDKLGVKMAASYKKLWKILIDRNMRKEDLRVAAGITTTAMAKLGKNETVHMDILLKICKVLDCKIEDIVEITDDVVDKAKKLQDANNDIEKIDEMLSDTPTFHHKADSLYEELIKNSDYSKYIIAAKIAKCMMGNLQFKQLPFLQKRNVFVMIRESISAYILNELAEKREY